MSSIAPMLAYPYDSARLQRWPTPWLVQPKIDGIRCLAVYDSGGALSLWTRGGKAINTVPSIYKALYELHLTCIVLDGELYLGAHTFQDLCHVIKRKEPLWSREADVTYQIFDIIPAWSTVQHERTALLEQDLALRVKHPLHIVSSTIARSLNDLDTFLIKHMEQGYEGIILRNLYTNYVNKRTTDMLKLKPRQLDAYTIIGVSEEISIHGTRKDALGALHLAAQNGEIFSVGTGFTRAQRISLWKERDSLVGKTAILKYQTLTERGVPRFPVLIEVAVNNAQGQTNKGDEHG